MTIFFNTFFRFSAIILCIFLFLLILFGFLSFFEEKDGFSKFKITEGNEKSQNKIVILSLEGPIISESVNFNFIGAFETINPNQLEKYLKEIKVLNPNFLIISINSPGGTVSASYEIYQMLTKFKNENKIKLFFHSNEILTSGAYWFSLAGDKIYASYGALVGSIGVRGPDWIYYDNPISISSGIFGNSIETKNGIKVFSQKAGKSKDLLNPFRKPTTIELEKLQAIINNIYMDFLNDVSKKRKIEKNVLESEIGAFVYNASIAKENFLVDEVINLKNLQQIIIKNNNFTDFQIIQNTEKNFSLIERYIFNIFGNFINNQKIISEQNICNKLKTNINSVSTNYLTSC